MFFEKTIENLVHDFDDIQGSVCKCLESCFQSTTGVPVEFICISFLYTSLYFNEPKFRISMYGENNLWGEPITSRDLNADWLFREWKSEITSEAELMEERKKIKPLLYYVSAYFKYFLVDCDKLKGFEEMQRAKELNICFGENKDWQYPIYRKREDIDIFQNINEESLEFRTFSNKVYHKKHFIDRNLTSSNFRECSFTQSFFEQVILNDVIFDHCKFENITFMKCNMYGITFRACVFEHCVFQSVEFTLVDITAQTLTGIYKTSEFIACKMIDTKFQDCNTEKVEIS